MELRENPQKLLWKTNKDLSIQPIDQQAYLKASNTETNDHFGDIVAVDGDTVVVAATYEDSNASGIGGNQDDNSAQDSGAVYVYICNGSTWSQQAYIKASNTNANDGFGSAVALDGDTLVVGARYEDSSATGINGDQINNSSSDAGAVYVFTRSGSTWTQQAYIKASNTDAGDNFGAAVALDGDTLVVGAHYEDSSATGMNGDQNDNSASNAGAAYMFTRSDGTWSQQGYLKASNSEDNDAFGYFGGVGIDGELVAIGAFTEDSDSTGINSDQNNNLASYSGASYLFHLSIPVFDQNVFLPLVVR